MKSDIEGKRIIITGAAGGIGAAAVRGFAERGARIAATYHSKPPSDDIRDLADWYHCDLTVPDETEKVFGDIAAGWDGLDALVNVAGKWQEGPPENIDEEHIEFMIGANLKSVMYSNRAAFRLLKDKGGRIINFGSIEGVEGSPISPVYAASKAAVHAWTRSVARSWGKYQITVNALAPFMWSPGFEYFRSLMSPEQVAAQDEEFRQRVPIDGKMGDPLRDCVPVLAFLVSDGSRFITGQLLSVDGGLKMLGA